jgi:hypothetical protein
MEMITMYKKIQKSLMPLPQDKQKNWMKFKNRYSVLVHTPEFVQREIKRSIDKYTKKQNEFYNDPQYKLKRSIKSILDNEKDRYKNRYAIKKNEDNSIYRIILGTSMVSAAIYLAYTFFKKK